MFLAKPAGMCGVPLMTFELDYADCIIPTAEATISVGKACGERGDADLTRNRSRCYTDRNSLS
jgi:hypothetical protein